LRKTLQYAVDWTKRVFRLRYRYTAEEIMEMRESLFWINGGWERLFAGGKRDHAASEDELRTYMTWGVRPEALKLLADASRDAQGKRAEETAASARAELIYGTKKRPNWDIVDA
jgi:hypothetical protein